MDKKKIVDTLFEKIEYTKAEKEIIDAIENAKIEMEVARSAFQYASDDNLIEALIYREHDINARYEYLIKQAKKRGLKVGVEHIFKDNYNIG